jgi:hypothetical protein
MWNNCVPVLLLPSVSNKSLPLSNQKPDKTFKYSKMAFTWYYERSNDESGGTDAMPDQRLYYVECRKVKDYFPRIHHLDVFETPIRKD